MKKHFLGLALSIAAFTGAASASSINLTYQDSGLFGASDLQQTVKITTSGPGYDGNVKAGMFHMKSDDALGNFLAFCVDLTQYIGSPMTAEYNSNLFTGTTYDNLSRLFSSVLGGSSLAEVIDTSLEAAALQVAIWEVMLDSSGAYDLNSGAFKMGSNVAVKTQAQSYLTNLWTGKVGDYKLTFLESAQNQDLVTVTPVPLPAGGVLIGTGLIALFAAGRRRKAA
ncbi:VPLPA-CTERM sorting domain-containing protein [Albibacillus kandeliae]|uniref:VPLPA-CTERM sorting domain-containing protein n=1 Tax=Albibacillus kandeliae TaxID=2174228 RepID=UPI000D69522F|nr:VPLPA-CTERM sorting domain-containing protein [Albibacillus kandeliae]